ncbi:hypothetical protein ABIE26_005179 [Pedobacter africanus]|uniref:Uncharacterized protein n=1 Tax=Pedobacter africanus TaxID=151894 RepID=A0ACC6L5C4_9SPHI|nr:hypothetical protein [Pedobacter africanus]MDR6786635.1 hypothetical protein [Pedobacter africanus]
MNFYLIRNRKAPWGDYGNILLYGFISKESDQINIERIGPFLPAAYSYNKYIAVVDSVKQALEKYELKGLNLSKGKKKKIIPLDWQDWAIAEPIPHKPKSGEPEDFILKGKHDELLANEMDEIWIISPTDTAKGVIDKAKKVPDEYNHITLDLTSWNGNDVFRTPQLGHIFCTENFKVAVEHTPDSHLTFVPIISV